MRTFVIIIITMLIPFSLWTAGCRKDDRQAAFPKGPEVKNLARKDSRAKTAQPEIPPAAPAIIDPEILSAPDQPTFARIRAVMDREAALASHYEAPGLFVLPREDYPDMAELPAMPVPSAPAPQVAAAPLSVREFWSKPAAMPVDDAPRAAYGDVAAMAPPAPYSSYATPSGSFGPEAIPGMFFGMPEPIVPSVPFHSISDSLMPSVPNPGMYHGPVEPTSTLVEPLPAVTFQTADAAMPPVAVHAPAVMPMAAPAFPAASGAPVPTTSAPAVGAFSKRAEMIQALEPLELISSGAPVPAAPAPAPKNMARPASAAAPAPAKAQPSAKAPTPVKTPAPVPAPAKAQSVDTAGPVLNEALLDELSSVLNSLLEEEANTTGAAARHAQPTAQAMSLPAPQPVKKNEAINHDLYMRDVWQGGSQAATPSAPAYDARESLMNADLLQYGGAAANDPKRVVLAPNLQSGARAPVKGGADILPEAPPLRY